MLIFQRPSKRSSGKCTKHGGSSWSVAKQARKIASAYGIEWIASLPGVIESCTDGTHVWLVLDGVRPRPDALGALVLGQERLDAAVTGSKVLDEDNPDRLLSVGFATDVFETPYTGFDEDERDQGQYDVVRDVAAVGGQSTLIRIDLARGLGGPDAAMAPFAAAVDFCQRARLRGARVVAVPSSEVLSATIIRNSIDGENALDASGR